MDEFPKSEKEGALNDKIPVYGYEHLQFGLEVWSEPQVVEGMQSLGGVVYDELDSVGWLQYGNVASDSIHNGLLSSLKKE